MGVQNIIGPAIHKKNRRLNVYPIPLDTHRVLHRCLHLVSSEPFRESLEVDEAIQARLYCTIITPKCTLKCVSHKELLAQDIALYTFAHKVFKTARSNHSRERGCTHHFQFEFFCFGSSSRIHLLLESRTTSPSHPQKRFAPSLPLPSSVNKQGNLGQTDTLILCVIMNTVFSYDRDERSCR